MTKNQKTAARKYLLDVIDTANLYSRVALSDSENDELTKEWALLTDRSITKMLTAIEALEVLAPNIRDNSGLVPERHCWVFSTAYHDGNLNFKVEA